MQAEDVASIRRGIGQAQNDFDLLYSFYSGSASLDLYDDFLSLGDLNPDALEGRAWKRTICQEVHRLEGILVTTHSHTRL